MPPGVFGISHIIALGILISLMLLFRNIYRRSEIRPVRLIAASLNGVIAGVLGGYALAQILTPLMRFSPMHSMSGVQYGDRFLFWSLFVGLSCIGFIAGGLGGIVYARKNEMNMDD